MRLFRRLLCSAVILMLILPLVVLSALAIREDLASYVQMINDCDTAWDARFTLDTQDKTQGAASCAISFNPHTGEGIIGDPDAQTLLVLQNHFETPFDVSKANAFSFDYYISDVSVLKEIGPSSAQFELTSSGKCDEEEMNWSVASLFKDAKNGWNHALVLFDEQYMKAHGFRPENFNFHRLYIWFDAPKAKDRTVVMKFDNFQFKYLEFHTQLDSFDSKVNVSSSTPVSVDTEGFIEGTGSVKWQINPVSMSSFSFMTSFLPTDVDGCTVLTFLLYISNSEYYRYWQGDTFVELATGNKKGVNCYRWNLLEDTFLPVQVGWNRIELRIEHAEVLGNPSLKNVSSFRMYMDSIESDTSYRTTFRIDDLHMDIAQSEIEIGGGSPIGTDLPMGRIYDDDDGFPESETQPPETETETEEPPVETDHETETDPSESESEAEPAGPAESESETGQKGTMLDEGGDGDNGYTTEHAKKVAGITATILCVGTAIAVVLIVVVGKAVKPV